jgi:hypothetical protein
VPGIGIAVEARVRGAEMGIAPRRRDRLPADQAPL